MASFEFDEIGYWSQVKLDIIGDYAKPYSTILTAKNLAHIYVDAFSGPGQHLVKGSSEFVLGSPLKALQVSPSFNEYHFIDLNSSKLDFLRSKIGERPDVHYYSGDCNAILRQKIYPTLAFESYRRALILLDPYGLHLEWETIREAGQLRTVDMFLNFPVMDMNRNALWRDPKGSTPEGRARLTRFWGDESWMTDLYPTDGNLFGHPEKAPNEAVAEVFRRRLKNVAGFRQVPSPIPMRNGKGAIVYYLFFASQKPVAAEIISDIFDKYRNAGSPDVT